MMMILPWVFWGIAVAGIAVQVHDYVKERREYSGNH